MEMKARVALSRRTTLGLLAAAAASPHLPAFAAQDGAAAKLRALLAESVAADEALDPLGATRRGTAPSGPPFVDPLGDAYASTLEQNKRRELERLRAIDRSALSAVDRIAYDVFQYRTKQTLDLFDSGLFAVRRRVPLNPSFGLHVEVPDFFANARYETPADYEQGLAILAGFSGHMTSAVTRLKEGKAAGYVQPKIVVTNVLAQAKAMLAQPVEQSPFYAPVRNLPSSMPAADRERLSAAYREMIRSRVYPNYQLWTEYLSGTYLSAASDAVGRSALKDGAALYASELAFHTTTSRSADDIHKLGLSEVSRIRSEMEKVRPQLGFSGNLHALFEYVRTDPRFYCKTQEELLSRFAEIEGRIWPAIPKLFHARPKAPFRVAPLPALGDQRGTGYYRPGPPDGVTPGTLFFNMSMLNTRPIPTLETLTLHEGIPGHHFQITLARENESLPPLLRFGSATAYSEGWGLYAESLGSQLGMFKDPWQWFGHLDMEMLRAVRLVVDTGIHAKGWDRQKAIDYMLANTSMAPRDVAVEIDRYIAFPGQACAYKIGELTIARLRGVARQALGPRFDIRSYHEQVLDTGALPMAVLETKIGDWIKTGGARA